ncbi:DUF6297 family protein [Arthrobacter pityocampae]|uniref:DUF6297 family protein n=1 Tax=Arthrobacter pityocampae TaxID=547334 RepID=UPI003736ECCF
MITRSSGTNADSLGVAQDIVRFTRAASRQFNKARSSVRDLFTDIYSIALAGSCVIMMAVSLFLALRDELAQRGLGTGFLVEPQWQVLPADALWIFLTYLVLIGITSTARTLGPVTVSGAQGSWWLPLPISRRSMVLPSFRKRLIATGAVAALAYIPFSLLTTVDRTAWAHASSSVTFGAVAVIAVTAAATLQLKPAHARSLQAVMFAVLIPLAVLPFFAPAVWSLVLPIAGAITFAAYVFVRAGEIHGAELVRGGAVSGHAGGSIFFLDVNELRRSVAVERRRPSNGRAASLYARSVRGPLTAMVRADMVAFLRLQPAPVTSLIWLAICIAVVLITPSLPVFLQLGIIVIAACVTTAESGMVARRIAMIPELDVLLPIRPALVRCSRMLMPCVAMAAWMTILTGVMSVLSTIGPALVLLGALAGVGMGAGAVRAATRPPTDWMTPPVETPFGSIPANQLSSLLRGTDMTVLALIPVIFALYLGDIHPGIILAQCLATTIAITVHTSTSHSAQ